MLLLPCHKVPVRYCIPLTDVGTRNALIPLCFNALSVVANTITAPASAPLVTQAFVPFKRYPESVSTAVVEAAPASLPLSAKNQLKLNYAHVLAGVA